MVVEEAEPVVVVVEQQRVVQPVVFASHQAALPFVDCSSYAFATFDCFELKQNSNYTKTLKLIKTS